MVLIDIASNLFSWNNLVTLILLVGLELVLGVDNIIVLSLVVAPLSEEMRHRARIIGLSLALIFRLLLVSGAFYLVRLSTPLIAHFSLRDLILLAGGIFLMGKAGKELYAIIEYKELKSALVFRKKFLSMVILQVVLLDLLFSVDSVITAVGLTHYLAVIVCAVILSFSAVLCYVRPLGEFIVKHPSLKILALAFIFIIGGNLVIEGFGYDLPKEFTYFAMIFACVVEFLQMRYRKKLC